MGRFWRLLRPGRRAAADRRRRHRPPEVCALEARELTTITGFSPVTSSTQILTPPDGRRVPVTLTGAVSNDRPTPPIVELHVIDEYRRVNTAFRVPVGRLEIPERSDRVYSYSSTVLLEASRSDQDRAGRQYYLFITVEDEDNGGARVVPVVVPFDPRHLPTPQDHTGNGAAPPPNARRRPRSITPGSGRPTGRRGGSR
jgi:hypothetical protein